MVVKDGMAHADQVKRILKKVSRLINHVCHSTVSSEIFEGFNCLQISNATRWNSELTMLESLMQVIDSSAMEEFQNNGKLDVHKCTIIKDLIKILTPFKWATDITQGENRITASTILPVIRGLRDQLHYLSNKFNSILQIPASSGPVERLFSIAGKVFRPDRCRLTDEMFAKLMFIRCNELCEVNVDVV